MECFRADIFSEGKRHSEEECLFLFNRKLRSLLNKTLRGMRARANEKYVAKATALGARVPQAELFVLVATAYNSGMCLLKLTMIATKRSLDDSNI